MPALRADRVYRGPGNCGPGAVLFEDGVIVDVGPGDGPLPRSAGDLGDVTVLPGLVDSHVHLAFDASPDPVADLAALHRIRAVYAGGSAVPA